MLLAAYLDDGKQPQEAVASADPSKPHRLRWEELPNYPKSRMHAAMVHLVNSAPTGKLASVNEDALREIQRMDSVIDLQVYGEFLDYGNFITPTVDIRTDCGWVQMLSVNEDSFQRDFDRIVELMPTLFVTEVVHD